MFPFHCGDMFVFCHCRECHRRGRDRPGRYRVRQQLCFNRGVVACGRIVYLDPTLKEGYNALAGSLSWRGDLQERKEKFDNYMKYLSFPQTDVESCMNARKELLFTGGYPSREKSLWKGREEEYVAMLTDLVTWKNRTLRSSVYVELIPSGEIAEWWGGHPKERLRFYECLIDLAGDKPGDRTGLYAALAKCHEQLGNMRASERYKKLLNEEISRTPSFNANEMSAWPSCRAVSGFRPEFGSADAMILRRKNYRHVTTEPVSLASAGVVSVSFLHGTESGL